MKGLTLVGVATAACSLMACDRDSTMFSDIHYLRAGLESPYTQERLAHCKAIEHEACLGLFNRARVAKKRLFSMGRGQALQLTLDTILKECGDEATDDAAVCGGAVSALYFFPTESDDRALQAFFLGAPSILNRVVDVDSTWLLNRVDKQMWRAWVSTLEDAFDRETLLHYLDEDTLNAKSVGTLTINVL